MTKFWQLNEDPSYDEDGVLVDEDFADTEVQVDIDLDELDPFATINS